ncbi:MAG: hypothetical protein EOM21_18565 [Gammaproteobacteria bacterium]|nr:hypothetical protein [Gammaproteobacteria bacterium]
MEHEKILQMIESVDRKDIVTLEEINARVWAYIWLHGDFKISFSGGTVHYRRDSWPPEERAIIHYPAEHAPVTRSCDALPDWPEGYRVQEQVTILPDKALCDAAIDNGSVMLTPWKPVWCATECLARLHTRIQAIAYERGPSC